MCPNTELKLSLIQQTAHNILKTLNTFEFHVYQDISMNHVHTKLRLHNTISVFPTLEEKPIEISFGHRPRQISKIADVERGSLP